MANIFEEFKTKKKSTIQYVTDGNTKELLIIDANISEQHTLEAQATKHEVEDGSEISDHVIRRGRFVVIEGVISDTPISLAQAAVGNLGGIVGSIAEGPRAKAVSTFLTAKIGSRLLQNQQGKGKPSKTALEALEYLYENGIPATITIPGLNDYTNMIMENLSIPRTARNAGGLQFTASFRKINIAVSEVVQLPPEVLSGDVASAAGQTNLGKLVADEAGAAIEDRGSSLALKILENF